MKARPLSTVVLDAILLIIFSLVHHQFSSSSLPWACKYAGKSAISTPFPLCSLHLQTHFSASYVAKFLERAHDHSLFLSLPASLNPTSARLTSLPLHCNRFCLGHQLPIACKIQWSIPCPYLTWFPSIICHSGLLAPWNTFYTWLPGYHSLLVFLLPH